MHSLDARNFGAVGDISTDDTRALQTVIVHAATLHVTDFISEGTYLINTIITEKTKVDVFLSAPVQEPCGIKK
jgi:polygalacturonase